MDYKLAFKDFVKNGGVLEEKKSKKKKKKKKGGIADSWFTGANGGIPVGSGGMDGGGIGESLLSEIFGGLDALCTSQNANTVAQHSKLSLIHI